MSQELPFDPFPFLSDPHRQTIVSTFFTFLKEPYSEQKLVTLPDGDKISLEITTPATWKPDHPTVFLVHGLCGSHRSSYLVRMTTWLEEIGIRAVRYNMRGCGSGKGLAKQIYHCGRSEDVFECLKVLKKESPDSPIVLLGYSLGGNIVLKTAGELGSLAPLFIQKVLAISPPVDLYSTMMMFADPANAIYEKYFYRLLRADVHYRHKKFKELPRVTLPRNLKLYEFDQIYTAPVCGFSNVMDYYDKCSSSNYVSEIAVPCKILFAEDDPIICHSSLDQHHLPANIAIFKTKKGGHVGYIGRSSERNVFYWLDSLLIDWIKEP